MAVDLKSLRRRCLLRVRELAIPQPFDLTELCAHIAASRGRDIRLLPMALPSTGPCGLWMATEQTDYIVYQQSTTPLHQEHIVLHEVGHLLCRHGEGRSLDNDHIGLAFRRLDPAAVQRILARTRYSTDEEREAEMIASLILHRARRTGDALPAADPRDAAVLARLQASMDSSRSG
jgi:hypothetical protein